MRRLWDKWINQTEKMQRVSHNYSQKRNQMGFLGFFLNRISNTECDVPKTGQAHGVNPT